MLKTITFIAAVTLGTAANAEQIDPWTTETSLPTYTEVLEQCDMPTDVAIARQLNWHEYDIASGDRVDSTVEGHDIEWGWDFAQSVMDSDDTFCVHLEWYEADVQQWYLETDKDKIDLLLSIAANK